MTIPVFKHYKIKSDVVIEIKVPTKVYDNCDEFVVGIDDKQFHN